MADPTTAELKERSPEFAAAFEANVAKMAEVAKDLTDEQFASRTVGLLIHDKGNLNRYQETLELVFAVHSRVLAMRAADKPVGNLLDVGKQNPRILVTPDEVNAWLRSIADAHGFRDRESVAVQIAWADNDALGGREIRHVVPELIIMVSNIPNSRVPS